MKKNIISILAIVILIAALAFNFYAENKANQEIATFYDELLGIGETYEPIGSNAVKVMKDGSHIGFAGLEKYNGFGGPMLVGLVTDTDGNLTTYKIIEHKETPQYLERIANEGFYLQYDGKNVDSGLVFGIDIEGISAATLSTRAFANSIDSISETIRVEGLGLPPQTASVPWQIGIAEISVAILIALMIAMITVPKFRKARPILLLLSIIAVGFWLNRPVSMAQISGLFMGYFPVFKTNLLWYLLLAAALLPALITGKNYYCTYLCPFGGATELVSTVTKKAQLPLASKVPFLRKTRNLIVFAALLVAFLFHNPSVSSFEPFAALFSFEASGIQWLLLISVIAASIFFKRFWCNGFCPVGGFLDIVADYRRRLGKVFSTKDKKAVASSEKPVKPSCPHAGGCEPKEISKKEKMAEGLFKLFYAIIIFSVVVAIFEKWAIL